MKKYIPILALALLVVACKSAPKEPQDAAQLKAEVPDAKADLYVVKGDTRFVDEVDDSSARQIHYYSAKRDKTYVVDEKSGVVLTSYSSKKMPELMTPTEPEVTKEACGCGIACGCGEAACGCGEACGCGAACGCADTGCGDGCACACGCGE